jgi:amidase
MAEGGRMVTGAQYLAALEDMNDYSRRVAGWWADDGFDLLVTPTVAQPPPKLGLMAPLADPGEALALMGEMAQFTVPWDVTGQPAVSLPLHWTADGLPVGVQLIAAYGREDLLLRVASQLEQAAPWADRRPPVFATS